MPPLIRALRPLHWLKNLLVLVPLFTSGLFVLPRPWLYAGLGFLALSFTASAGYLVNDLVDLEADRAHPTKCRRPLASSSISRGQAMMTALVLLVLATGTGIILGTGFLEGIGIYFAVTLSYSLWLKMIPVVDVIVLGLLFTIRIIVGCAAISVVPSFWLLAFSLFFFLSIALAKRFVELKAMIAVGNNSLIRRGYRAEDRDMISSMGVASGYVSVLVLALYVNSDQIRTLYRHPHVFWGLCLLVLYWNSRTWFLAHRGALREDPVLFAATDGISWLIAGITILLLLLAR
ncbi:UbiA family prenyltransferase [Thermodesulfobacteriota bacterium B35]